MRWLVTSSVVSGGLAAVSSAALSLASESLPRTWPAPIMVLAGETICGMLVGLCIGAVFAARLQDLER